MATWQGVAWARLDTEQEAAAEMTTWVGPGSGRLCSGCSRIIGFGEVECEVELPDDLGIKPLRFHLECYCIWSGEKRMD